LERGETLPQFSSIGTQWWGGKKKSTKKKSKGGPQNVKTPGLSSRSTRGGGLDGARGVTGKKIRRQKKTQGEWETRKKGTSKNGVNFRDN